jgi:carbohydrate kinase (thermoresistant glucokinase family)
VISRSCSEKIACGAFESRPLLKEEVPVAILSEVSRRLCGRLNRGGPAIVYIIMGIAGSGKTTIGRLLAEKLHLPFHDGDDYHSPGNVAKMRQGIPLTDDDRKPWLEALARGVAEWNRAAGAVLACSALKEVYRRKLTRDGTEQVVFIHLQGPPGVINSRVRHRSHHYFPPGLLHSQLDILEPPADAITVDVRATPEEICGKILQELSERKLL